MTRDQFIAAGQAAFGKQWQTEISEELGVSSKTVRNWVAGKYNIPPIERELIEVLKRRTKQIDEQISALTEEMKMTKGINEFLSDTESFKSGVIFKAASAENDKNWLFVEIARHVEEIARQIGDIDQGNFVSVRISRQVILTLGSLGNYHIETSPENLAALCNRLTCLSSSGKFIRLLSE
ncbi:hypothetical protein CYD30_28380 [Kosakonia cowanii]|nr:hypothetical protein CYD30_28380 [Kosakonia cowanii]